MTLNARPGAVSRGGDFCSRLGNSLPLPYVPFVLFFHPETTRSALHSRQGSRAVLAFLKRRWILLAWVVVFLASCTFDYMFSNWVERPHFEYGSFGLFDGEYY